MRRVCQVPHQQDQGDHRVHLQNPHTLLHTNKSAFVRNQRSSISCNAKFEKEPPHSLERPLPPLPSGSPTPEPKLPCSYSFRLWELPLSVTRNKLDQIVSNISGKTESPTPKRKIYTNGTLSTQHSITFGLPPQSTQTKDYHYSKHQDHHIQPSHRSVSESTNSQLPACTTHTNTPL